MRAPVAPSTLGELFPKVNIDCSGAVGDVTEANAETPTVRIERIAMTPNSFGVKFVDRVNRCGPMYQYVAYFMNAIFKQ